MFLAPSGSTLAVGRVDPFVFLQGFDSYIYIHTCTVFCMFALEYDPVRFVQLQGTLHGQAIGQDDSPEKSGKIRNGGNQRVCAKIKYMRVCLVRGHAFRGWLKLKKKQTKGKKPFSGMPLFGHTHPGQPLCLHTPLRECASDRFVPPTDGWVTPSNIKETQHTLGGTFKKQSLP